MPDHVLIYLIVLLNALCQVMLIWRLKQPDNSKYFFVCCAVLIPLATAFTMRFLVSGGIIHGHLNEQTQPEQLLTKAMSILLIAGPWLATLWALLDNRSKKRSTQQA